MIPFAERIEKHIDYWSEKASAKAFRPKFVYHFTELANAVSILESGSLYSRYMAEKLELMKNENASSDVIGNTLEKYKRFARLYFRPRTPTQYHNEGIRPQSERYGTAHCAVPFFFAFDKLKTLSLPGVHLSNGNVAKPSVVVRPAGEYFENIPFDKVFHYGRVDMMCDSDIIFHRHAEILVPKVLKLDESLAWIGCRSHAERQTLISLLSRQSRSKYLHLIRIADSVFFEKAWIFIDNVTFDGKQLTFYFNPSSRHIGQVAVKLMVTYGNGQTATIERELTAKSLWPIKFRAPQDVLDVQLYVLGCLAFSGRLHAVDLV